MDCNGTFCFSNTKQRRKKERDLKTLKPLARSPPWPTSKEITGWLGSSNAELPFYFKKQKREGECANFEASAVNKTTCGNTYKNVEKG